MIKKSFFAIALLLSFSFYSCTKDDEDTGEDILNTQIAKYSSSVKEINTTLNEFIEKAQEFETTNVETMPIEDIKPFMDDYISSAQKYLDALEESYRIQQNSSKSPFKNIIDGPDCSIVDFTPTLDNGVGVGLVIAVANLIEETKGKVKIIQDQYEAGEIDDELYIATMNKLKQNQAVKASNVGFGAVVGTGAAVFTGLVVGVATLPALATIAVVGGTVGTVTTWFSNWRAGVNKNGDPQYFMISGKTTVGKGIPLSMFENNSQVVIAVDGFAPVAINNFELPEAGINKTIEIKGVKLEDAQWDGSTEVCFYEEEMEASSCTEVQFVSALPSPIDPGPSQDVTVIATLIPSVENCDISFSIVGTDGYSDSATSASDANGQASFHIPGGEEGVVDHVTITSSNGKSYTVTYVF